MSRGSAPTASGEADAPAEAQADGAGGPLGFLDAALARAEREALRRSLREVQDAPAARVRVGRRSLVLLCSNAYLGLNRHPEVVRAAAEAVQVHGTGSGASRLVSGSLPVHRGLEADIASLKGTEDAVLFSSGFAANVGTIPALVGRGDAVFSDTLNHASLVDGCRLSRADVQVYAHADPDDLAGRLRRCEAPGRRLVVTDGVFSMDGDIAPLRALADVCEEHDAILMVDDAHGTGVLGPEGAGTAAEAGVAERVHVHMGTLSKALGTEGGFIAGSRTLCEWLRNRARPFVFSTAPAPASAAAAAAAIRVMRREEGLRLRLHRQARRLREGLAGRGLPVAEGRTPIVPVLVGGAADTMRLMAGLEERGVFAVGIRPPTVPPGTARIRATVMASHSDDDIDAAVDAFGAAWSLRGETA